MAQHLKTPALHAKLMPADKLRAKFYGPYKVKRWVSPVTVELALPQNLSKAHPVFHVSRIRKYRAADAAVVPAQFATITNKDVEDDHHYEISHIRGHRKVANPPREHSDLREFLVEYKDYDQEDVSWVSHHELATSAPELLRRYLATLTARRAVEVSDEQWLLHHSDFDYMANAVTHYRLLSPGRTGSLYFEPSLRAKLQNLAA